MFYKLCLKILTITSNRSIYWCFTSCSEPRLVAECLTLLFLKFQLFAGILLEDQIYIF